jgi:hypothetical protein
MYMDDFIFFLLLKRQKRKEKKKVLATFELDHYSKSFPFCKQDFVNNNTYVIVYEIKVILIPENTYVRQFNFVHTLSYSKVKRN